MKILINSTSSIFLALFIALVFIGCDTKKTTLMNNRPVFSGHVSGYTSGLISNTSAINVRLIDAVSEEVFNSGIEADIFDFEPKIEGTTKWIDHQSLFCLFHLYPIFL